MNTTLVILATAVTAATGLAADKSSDDPTETKPHHSSFSLVPKSLQKNPKIDCNIITEVTPAGKKLRSPTTEKPTYYFLQAGYYQSLGEAAPANAKPPAVALLERAMKDSLAANGYREADPPKHQPTLVIVFNYGDHSANLAELDDAMETAAAQAAFEQAASERATLEANLEMSLTPPSAEARENQQPAPPPPQTANSSPITPEQLLPYVLADSRKQRELIDRAGIVGGVEFAKDLAAVLKKEVKVRRLANQTSRGSRALTEEIDRQKTIDSLKGIKSEPSLRAETSFNFEMASPFYLFYRRDNRTSYLVDVTFGSCYFVVASAFDGAAVANGERRLLWRTKMTVNSIGIGMGESLPTLIAAAAPYFGRELKQTTTVSKRITRAGKVDVGTPTIIEHTDTPPSKPDDPAKTNAVK